MRGGFVTTVCIQAAERELDAHLTDPAMSGYGACLAEEVTKGTLIERDGDSKESNR